MNTKTILSIGLIAMSSLMFSCGGDSNSSSSAETYVEPTPSCKPSTSKVRSLVRSNWSSIKSHADFTVSNKKSFEIQDYGMDGDELSVSVYSKGYWYDISFTVSFDAYFDDDCNIDGDVTDVYNYVKY